MVYRWVGLTWGEAAREVEPRGNSHNEKDNELAEKAMACRCVEQ